MNFQPTHITQSCAALRKDSRRQHSSQSLRCDRHAELTLPLSPKSFRDLQYAEKDCRALNLPTLGSGELIPRPEAVGRECCKEYLTSSRRLIETVKDILSGDQLDEVAFERFKHNSTEHFMEHKQLRGSARSFQETQSIVHALLRHHNHDEWDKEFSKRVRASLRKRLDAVEATLETEEASAA